MNYALNKGLLCPPNSALMIGYKESVEDFVCLFIFFEASPNALTRINSPPLRSAIYADPLPGVDISKHESAKTVLWLLVVKFWRFSKKSQKTNTLSYELAKAKSKREKLRLKDCGRHFALFKP